MNNGAPSLIRTPSPLTLLGRLVPVDDKRLASPPPPPIFTIGTNKSSLVSTINPLNSVKFLRLSSSVNEIA